MQAETCPDISVMKDSLGQFAGMLDGRIFENRFQTEPHGSRIRDIVCAVLKRDGVSVFSDACRVAPSAKEPDYFYVIWGFVILLEDCSR